LVILKDRNTIAHVLLNRIVDRSGTTRNNLDYAKPNEDYLIVDDKNKVHIICDGVTRNLIDGSYPEPSPSYLAAKTDMLGWYVLYCAFLGMQ
jgi:hypothetical protein